MNLHKKLLSLQNSDKYLILFTSYLKNLFNNSFALA